MRLFPRIRSQGSTVASQKKGTNIRVGNIWYLDRAKSFEVDGDIKMTLTWYLDRAKSFEVDGYIRMTFSRYRRIRYRTVKSRTVGASD